MSNLLLRKMTMRSIIGFGFWPELSVQELIQLGKHKELINMYYRLEKIDYNDEIKEHLGIKDELVITKPGKNYEMYKQNIYEMLCKINDLKNISSNDDPMRFIKMYQIKKSENVRKVRSNLVRQNKENAKINNRTRNQGKSF